MESINVQKKLAFSQNLIWIIIWQFGLSACNKIFHFFPSLFRGRTRICLLVSPARAYIGFQFTKCLNTCTRTCRISVAFNRTRMQFQMHFKCVVKISLYLQWLSWSCVVVVVTWFVWNENEIHGLLSLHVVGWCETTFFVQHTDGGTSVHAMRSAQYVQYGHLCKLTFSLKHARNFISPFAITIK